MKELNYKRIGIYLLGLLILGCGIDLNTKTQLGVSPIISVVFYNICLDHFKVPLSNTLSYYVLLAILAGSCLCMFDTISPLHLSVLSQAPYSDI